MNPDRQPHELLLDRVEWIPSSPDAIEVRVYGAWHGTTVPPPAVLMVEGRAVEAVPDPPAAGLAPAWTAAFLVPVEARAAVEAGEALLVAEGVELRLPPAVPGALDPPPGTVVDPAVLAERRARRAELAEESAARKAASAMQQVETLRAQMAHLEERAARAGEERDRLAARVADAERRLRLAEQREEGERRRRAELEEEVASARRGAEAEMEDLRARLAGAEELVDVLERELDGARRRADSAGDVVAAERAARRQAEEAAARAASEAEALRAQVEELRSRAADPAELEELRARAAEAERLRVEADALRDESARLRDESAAVRDENARLREEDAVLRPRAREAEELRAEAQALRDENARLREEDALLRPRAREADELRAEVEALRARAAAAESLRGRITDLERRLSQTSAPAEIERRLQAERAARAAAEERLAAIGRGTPSSERERALLAQVGALEDELRRRTAVHERVQEAIGLVRAELEQVRAQVETGEAVAELRAEVGELEARLRARAQELEETRRDLARARAETATARAESDELRAALAELRERLDSREEAPPRPDPLAMEEPDTGDPALDALIAGLREQVAAAREQLAKSAEPPLAEPEAERSELPEADAAPSASAAGPSASEAGPSASEAGPSAPEAGPSAPPAAQEGPSAAEPPPPLDAPLPPKSRPSPPEPATPSQPGDDETRRRLQAIAAELRAAVPEQPGAGAAGDVIGDLQRAAERLRAAAEQELERLEQPGEAGATPRPAPLDDEPEAAPVAIELEPRHVVPAARERPWLRTGLERLAQTDPETAGRLLRTLLPVQGVRVDELSYDLTAPATGTLRVSIVNRRAHVDPRDAPGERRAVDFHVDGTLEALAPLAAGGADKRLYGARTKGSRRKLRRLLKAMREPVGLIDLGLAGAPVHPGLLLTALAAAVEPAWTRGHHFAVAYAIAGDGTFTVIAGDGDRLRVTPGSVSAQLEATVNVGVYGLMPLLAGAVPPEGQHATVTGDRRAVEVLHAWFDAARGAAQQ